MTNAILPKVFLGFSLDFTSDGADIQGYVDYFQNSAQWSIAAAGSSGFMLDSRFVMGATAAQLQQVVSFLNAHHIAIILDAEMIPYGANGIGTGVEGYGNPAALTTMAQRIQAAGGTIAAVNMDGPLYYGHVATGAGTEQASIPVLAEQVATSFLLLKAVFPNIQAIDAEGPANAPLMAQWMSAFAADSGQPIAMVNADVNVSDPNWQSELETFAAVVRANGAQLGLGVYGDFADQSDASWSAAAETLMAAAAADPNIAPDAFAVLSWNPYPAAILPEAVPGSLTHVALETEAVTPLYASGAISGAAGGTVALVPPTNAGEAVTFQAVSGAPVTIPGISVSVSGTANASATFAVVVTAGAGTLSASASGQGAVGGNGGAVLTIVGTLATINAELKTLAYQGNAAGTDTIDLTLYDGAGLVGAQALAVSTAAPVAATVPASAQAIAEAQSQATTLLAQMTDAAPDAQSIALCTNALLGGMPLSVLQASIAQSAQVTAALTAVYAGLYGGSPGASWLSGMQTELASGDTLDQAIAPLLAGSSAESNVSALYTQVVGSAPSAGDLLAMTRNVLLGESLSGLRAGLSVSAAVVTPLTMMYEHVYGVTDVPAAQLAGMEAQIAGGASLAAVLGQLDSVARAEVTSLYQSVLDQSPTASQLTSTATGLEQGNTLASYRCQLVLTPAATALFNNAYQQIVGAAPSATMTATLQEVIANGLSFDQMKQDLTKAETMFAAIEGHAPAESDLENILNLYKYGWTDAQIAMSLAGAPGPTAALVAAYTADYNHAPDGATSVALTQQLASSSLAVVKASLVAAAAADVPTISGMSSSEALPWNCQTLPLHDITITDPDANQMETATVTLSAPIGTFGGGGGTVSSNGLSYTTITWHGDLVGNLLDGLTLYPAAVKANTAATLTLSVTNSLGHTTTETAQITVDSLAAPARGNFLFGTSGNDTIAATPMNDVFVETGTKIGNDVITGFDPVHDVLQLSKSVFANLTSVLAATTSVAGGAFIRLDANDSVSLPGIAPSALNGTNVQLV